MSFDQPGAHCVVSPLPLLHGQLPLDHGKLGGDIVAGVTLAALGIPAAFLCPLVGSSAEA